MSRSANLQVKMLMAQANLAAAQIAMAQSFEAFSAGRITAVERGRLLAKRTRLETLVFNLRAEIEGRATEIAA